MTDPIFPSRTPRLELPLLFVGQAQKEVTVNEAVSKIDALLCPAIEGELAAPPASPQDGQNWLVTTGASGEWTGRTGQIASRQSGNWFYTAPTAGLRLLNKATGQDLRYTTAWMAAARPATPSGGTTIDAEARAAIAGILACLTAGGILPAA